MCRGPSYAVRTHLSAFAPSCTATHAGGFCGVCVAGLTIWARRSAANQASGSGPAERSAPQARPRERRREQRCPGDAARWVARCFDALRLERAEVARANDSLNRREHGCLVCRLRRRVDQHLHRRGRGGTRLDHLRLVSALRIVARAAEAKPDPPPGTVEYSSTAITDRTV